MSRPPQDHSDVARLLYVRYVVLCPKCSTAKSIRADPGIGVGEAMEKDGWKDEMCPSCLLSPRPPRTRLGEHINVAAIVEECAGRFGLAAIDLHARSKQSPPAGRNRQLLKTAKNVNARRFLAVALRSAGMSTPAVARVCGYASHVNVLIAFQALSESDREAAIAVARKFNPHANNHEET